MSSVFKDLTLNFGPYLQRLGQLDKVPLDSLTGVHLGA